MSDVLLAAVDALTLPQREHVAVKDEAGLWERAHSVDMPPLLQRMADAVHPSSNTTTGSASSPATRSPVDVHALFEYSKMTSAIRDWCRIVGAPVGRDPIVNLRSWFWSFWVVGWETNDGFYVREQKRWAQQITNLLNPSEQFESDLPCPICHRMGWGNAVDGGSTRAILVTYRKDDEGRVYDERALCRPCQTVWVGHVAVKELQDELRDSIA